MKLERSPFGGRPFDKRGERDCVYQGWLSVETEKELQVDMRADNHRAADATRPVRVEPVWFCAREFPPTGRGLRWR